MVSLIYIYLKKNPIDLYLLDTGSITNNNGCRHYTLKLFLAQILTICWAYSISTYAAATSLILRYTGSSIIPNCECTGQKGKLSFSFFAYLLKSWTSLDRIQPSLKGMKQNKQHSQLDCSSQTGQDSAAWGWTHRTGLSLWPGSCSQRAYSALYSMCT